MQRAHLAHAWHAQHVRFLRPASRGCIVYTIYLWNIWRPLEIGGVGLFTAHICARTRAFPFTILGSSLVSRTRACLRRSRNLTLARSPSLSLWVSGENLFKSHSSGSRISGVLRAFRECLFPNFWTCSRTMLYWSGTWPIYNNYVDGEQKFVWPFISVFIHQAPFAEWSWRMCRVSMGFMKHVFKLFVGRLQCCFE
jgi:hypothetical protein